MQCIERAQGESRAVRDLSPVFPDRPGEPGREKVWSRVIRFEPYIDTPKMHEALGL